MVIPRPPGQARLVFPTPPRPMTGPLNLHRSSTGWGEETGGWGHETNQTGKSRPFAAPDGWALKSRPHAHPRPARAALSEPAGVHVPSPAVPIQHDRRPGMEEQLPPQEACEHGTRQVGLQPSALHAARRLFGPDWADLVGCSHSRPFLGLRVFGCQSHWPFDWTRMEDEQNPHWAAAWAAGMAGSPDEQSSAQPGIIHASEKPSHGGLAGGRHIGRQADSIDAASQSKARSSQLAAACRHRIGQCPIPCTTVTHPPVCGGRPLDSRVREDYVIGQHNTPIMLSQFVEPNNLLHTFRLAGRENKSRLQTLQIWCRLPKLCSLFQPVSLRKKKLE